MSRSKNQKYPLGLAFVVLPFFMACASGAGKPAATAEDADSKADSHELAEADDASDGATEPSKSDDSEGAKPAEDKADAKKPAAKESTASDAGDEEDEEIVDSSRSKEVCEKVLKDNKAALKEKCYEPVHKEKPDVKGVVHLFVKLDAAGKVTESHVGGTTTITEPKIVDCMIAMAKTFKFPASTQGLEKDVSYAYGFNNITVVSTNKPKKKK